MAGYRVYFGVASGTYLQPAGEGVYAGLATSFVVRGLQAGRLYYFAVTAVDDVGNESGFSNEASKRLP